MCSVSQPLLTRGLAGILSISSEAQHYLSWKPNMHRMLLKSEVRKAQEILFGSADVVWEPIG